MVKQNKEYRYKGAVTKDGMLMERAWEATTWAPTENKARAHLIYRYKRYHDIPLAANVELADKVTEVKRGDQRVQA